MKTGFFPGDRSLFEFPAGVWVKVFGKKSSILSNEVICLILRFEPTGRSQSKGAVVSVCDCGMKGHVLSFLKQCFSSFGFKITVLLCGEWSLRQNGANTHILMALISVK